MKKIPTVALVGMPNSGKSTLINRLANKKVAIVANESHTTRDLNWGEEIWEDLYIRFVDTGGLIPNPSEKIHKLVRLKTFSAISQADLLVWVIDRRTNVDAISLELMQNMWKSGKPFIIGINKVDNPNHERDISEYAHMGGNAFINFSAANGYNLNELMDEIVNELVKVGFEKGNFDEVPVELIYQEKRKSKDKRKIVKKNKDGTYYVVRHEDEKSGAPGTFQSLSASEVEGFVKSKINSIDTIVFDLSNVIYKVDTEAYILNLVDNANVNEDDIEDLIELINKYNEDYQYYEDHDFDIFTKRFKELTGGLDFNKDEVLNYFKCDQETVNTLNRLKKKNYKLLFLTDTPKSVMEKYKDTIPYKIFDGGITTDDFEINKVDLNIYYHLINDYALDPEKTIFFDANEKNVEASLRVGFWGRNYIEGMTDLEEDIEKVESAEVDRIKAIPKVLFMGKPNVGKSSLFNALAMKEVQIVSELAGTTLSVNDTVIERVVNEEK